MTVKANLKPKTFGLIWLNGEAYKYVTREVLGIYHKCLSCGGFLSNNENKLKAPGAIHRFFKCSKCGDRYAYLMRYQEVRKI